MLKLELLLATFDDTITAHSWPLSKTSAPTWIAICGAVFILWVISFVVIRKPDAIKRDEEKRGKYYCEMMTAVLAYSEDELKKPTEDQKLAEASRVYKLLWDDVHKIRTTRYNIDKTSDLNVKTENLFKTLLKKELEKAVEYTQKANKLEVCSPAATEVSTDNDTDADAGAGAGTGTDTSTDTDTVSTDPPPSNDEIKAIAEHRSGDKLHQALRFNKIVSKTMGRSFVDKILVTKAKGICREVYNQQSKQANSVFKLVGPVIPDTLKSLLLCCVLTAFRAKFHQIGVWVRVIEVGAGGDSEGALELLFELWMGHMIIKFLELPESTYNKRAKSMFGARIRNGVLAAMVRQDYEYFDKTPSGVLQERLNRDADELGDNLIGFPTDMLQKMIWIGCNLAIVYKQTPLPLFKVAVCPVIIMITFQYFAFQYFRQCNERMKRVGISNISATSEVLRQIKTVRQFAMEPKAAAQYARNGLSRHLMVEQVHVVKRFCEAFVWSMFDSGIALTIFFGLPYVVRGEMPVSALIDTFCKINFNICFCLREFIEKLPKFAELLQPLGRICDLLDSESFIEPPTDPAYVDLASPADLVHLFSLCERDDKTANEDGTTTTKDNNSRYYQRPVRTVAAAAIGGVGGSVGGRLSTGVVTKGKGVSVGGPIGGSPTTFTGPGAMKGSQLLSLTTVDHRFVVVEDFESINATDLAFPVRATFSTKLRPARFNGKIEFRNVTFSYPTELRTPVLKGMNFVVEPGQKVALVGATGCGKSSCMALLQRLYDPQEGTILIDDVPLQEYDIHFLRSRIVIVDQHTVLFTATIKDNITYGMEGVTDEQVIQACKDAKAWDFIDEKPDKLLTMISSGGSNLSGGQRQRLAIARAMVRRPDVILLDEATSALDNKNERLVQQALDKLACNGSALVIAHRLSTIRDSDKIIVVDHGKNAEEGTHDELLAHADMSRTSSSANISEDGDDTDAEAKHCLFTSAPGDIPTVAALAAVSEGRGLLLADDALPPPPHANPSLGRAKTQEAPAPPNSVESLRTPLGTSSNPSAFGCKEEEDETMSYRKLWDSETGAKKDSRTIRSMEERVAQMEVELAEHKAQLSSMKETKAALLSNGRSNFTSFSKPRAHAWPCRAPGLSRSLSAPAENEQ